MKRWAVWVALAACGTPPPVQPPFKFPSGFMWGASVAGFQVDMGCPTLAADQCEDRASDWYQLITNPTGDYGDQAANVTFEPPTRGPGHWELYDADLAKAKDELGLGAFRMSLEWSRIFPTATDAAQGFDALKALADAGALAKYHAMFAALKQRGLKPLVTLNHYTLPLWLHDGAACHKDASTCTKRGWLDADRAQNEIAKYAGFAAQEFGAEVDLWATQNEPFAVVLPGYLLPSEQRVNPPARSYAFDDAKAVITSMIVGHARMYDAVKANDTADADGDGIAASVGLVYSMVPVRPMDPAKPLDVKAASNVFYLYNTVFLDGVCKGDLDPGLTGRSTMNRVNLANRMDWLGVNYYTPLPIKGVDTASFPSLSPLTNFDVVALTSQGFVDDPKGIYEIAMWAKQRYGLPMIITENGTAVDDAADTANKAPSWIVRHLTWLSRAMRDGADVRGYFYWTLFDNYEWNHGMSIKMGLYGVDGGDATKARTARPAVGTYKAIIGNQGVPDSLAKQYPAPEN